MRTRSPITICLLTLTTASPALAATYDLTGTWSFSTSGNWVTGVCPKGADATGTLQITQSGDSFTMKLLSGMVCNPSSLCSYTGTIAGAVYTATNSAVVDTEGGKATNTITFTATSAAAASGNDSSSYVHPQGMTCTWGFNITLSRSAPDGPARDSGSALPGDAATDKLAGSHDKGTGRDQATAGDTGQPKAGGGGGCQLGGGEGQRGLHLLALLVLALWLGGAASGGRSRRPSTSSCSRAG